MKISNNISVQDSRWIARKMRRVPELSVAHFAYIVVTICDLSSTYTSHICNRIKIALRFLRYLSIAHSKAVWQVEPPYFTI